MVQRCIIHPRRDTRNIEEPYPGTLKKARQSARVLKDRPRNHSLRKGSFSPPLRLVQPPLNAGRDHGAPMPAARGPDSPRPVIFLRLSTFRGTSAVMRRQDTRQASWDFFTSVSGTLEVARHPSCPHHLCGQTSTLKCFPATKNVLTFLLQATHEAISRSLTSV